MLTGLLIEIDDQACKIEGLDRSHLFDHMNPGQCAAKYTK